MLPSKVKADQSKWWRKIPGMSSQALNESDFVMYQEQWQHKAHQIIAIGLHILILLCANHGFSIIKDKTTPVFSIFFMISGWATFKFMTNAKTYQIYNFEALFY